MQSGRGVSTGGGFDEESSEGDGKPGLFGNISILTAGDGCPPAVKKRLGNALVVNERNLRTPSPQSGASCDDDSEAESFRDGRSEEVDRDTRGRAFAWCRDFLSGSWTSIREDEFRISIVR